MIISSISSIIFVYIFICSFEIIIKNINPITRFCVIPFMRNYIFFNSISILYRIVPRSALTAVHHTAINRQRNNIGGKPNTILTPFSLGSTPNKSRALLVKETKKPFPKWCIENDVVKRCSVQRR